jgi:outer membrane protein TolC
MNPLAQTTQPLRDPVYRVRAAVFAIGVGLFLVAGTSALGAATPTHDHWPQTTQNDRLSEIAAEMPGPESQPADYVRFALLHHPAVAAVRHDWDAAQHAVAPAKALPDPQLTFQADIASTIMSLMPGVMAELMNPGKRAAMGREAEASLAVARAQYSGTLVRIAAEVRRALVELAYLDAALAFRHAAADTAEQSAQLAASTYAAGRGMDASLAAQIQAADTAERFRSEAAQLLDRRAAVRARLKSALGLPTEAADPAWPAIELAPTSFPTAAELWQRIQTSNPDLARMRAMVEMTVAGVAVARRGGSPDFSVGLMAEVKTAPWMWRPTATMTLPLWRAKIRETIAAAEARHDAALARLSAEQLDMAAELARMLAMVREADRMIEYIDRSALPAVQRQRDAAQSGYRTGGTGAAMIVESGAMELAMQTERLAALRERELAVIDLLAMTAGVASDGFSEVGPGRRAGRELGGPNGPALPAEHPASK